ncbi:membrane protease YdiL (CAAX protease family) [Naumannella cuiyingiana]|uniref:Membrane protease YdiL (CAAX protease family) n=1 Tax=Naumannella cuiyingiana TaxID=1347891 RepID=A0A7Z0IJP5_9ACTN|nr:CPBP family glutamic-type intramembrane protease [Naumannella cuiyingiana]NYI69622.1 membrane protease YdiL (CAAX protease family) [Naumannella cuiyingiana]
MTALAAPTRPVAATVAVFGAATALAAVPGWLLTPVHPALAAAYPFASAAPLVGALAVLVLRRPAALAVVTDLGGPVGRRAWRRVLLAGLAGLAVVLGLIQARTFLDWGLVPLELVVLPAPLAVVAAITLVAVTAQEIGWRGVLAPTLRARFGEPAAAAVTGCAWTAWALPGLAVLGGAQVVLLAIALVGFSVVIERLQGRLPGGRLLVAIAFRWVLAMGLLVFGDEEAGNVFALAVLAGVGALAAAIAWWGAPALDRYATAADRRTRP